MDRLSASVESSSNPNKTTTTNATENSSLCDSCDKMRDLLQKKDKEIQSLKQQLEMLMKKNADNNSFN